MLCYDSTILEQYYMLSTLLQNEIYLGFSSQKPIDQPTHEITFYGGLPIFLHTPEPSLIKCTTCMNQPLTFICQVFCPFEAQHCYNRVLYVFYCERCQREFRCLKQQSFKNQEIQRPKVQVRTISQKSFQISSDSIELKQLNKIKNKALKEIQQQALEEQEQDQFDEKGEDIDIKQIEINLQHLGIKEQDFEQEFNSQKMNQLKMATQSMQQTKKEQKDLVFQEYRTISNELDGPILLYSNIPLPYNSQPINHRHFCKFCNGKLTLQIQLTQKMLLVSSKLVNLDWGSLFVFTCPNSCQKSTQECVVVQFQTDAIQQVEVKQLKKKQKNRKRKEKNKKNEKAKEKQEPKTIQQKEESNQQGDWD